MFRFLFALVFSLCLVGKEPQVYYTDPGNLITESSTPKNPKLTQILLSTVEITVPRTFIVMRTFSLSPHLMVKEWVIKVDGVEFRPILLKSERKKVKKVFLEVGVFYLTPEQLRVLGEAKTLTWELRGKNGVWKGSIPKGIQSGMLQYFQKMFEGDPDSI